MIYPIVIYGSPVLRKVAQEIDKDYPDLEEFIKNMWETMYVSDGVGLAAPQVGKSVRLFVIDGSPFEEDEPQLKDFKKTFINAKIVERGKDEVELNEGCLSIPLLREDVSRPTKIRLQYQDEDFNHHDEWFEGMAARIIQHEYDHTEGILYIDHLKPLTKRLMEAKLKRIIKGQISTKYPIKFVKNASH